MTADPSGPRLHPRLVREFPPDLAVCIAVAILTTAAATLPGVRDLPLRIVLGLPFVLFVPGYAFVAALFPERGGAPSAAAAEGESDADGASEGEADGDEAAVVETAAGAADDDADGFGLRDRGIDGIERVALSFGLSIAVVPLIGLVLNFTPWGIRLVPILLAVGGFVVGASVVGAYRRLALPETERFRVPYRSWYVAGRRELLEPETRTDAVLNVLLVLAVVVAASSVVYAVAVPKQGEAFTEFYLLTETEDGELVADGYPTEFSNGAAKPLVVGIGSNEFERTNYSVVVVLQNVTFADGAGPSNATANVSVATVREDVELDRFGTRLGHNETWQEAYSVRPTLEGENLRLGFLLYRGTVPPDPTVENAYRELHLWINVSGAGS